MNIQKIQITDSIFNQSCSLVIQFQKLMNYQFPIQTCSVNNSRIIHNSQNIRISQSQIIKQLQKENQFLKRQLSTLMQKQSTPKHFDCTNSTQAYNYNCSEAEVEQNYKKKMTKLKTRKSNRRSLEAQNFTEPSSPRVAKLLNQTNHQIQKRITFAPLQNQDQSLKVMILQKDKNGRFYRDRQSEDKMQTVRMNLSPNSFFRKDKQSIKIPAFFATNTSKHLNSSLKKTGHQRYQSSPQPQQQKFLYEAQTKRNPQNYYERENYNTHIDFYEGKQSQKEWAVNYKTTNKVNQNNGHLKNDIKLNFKGKMQGQRQYVKSKIVSPRGNAYMDMVDSQEKIINKKQQQTYQSGSEESIVSIQKGLTQKKSTRKLRYDIYMSDQNDS